MNREEIELSEHILRSLLDEDYEVEDGYEEEFPELYTDLEYIFKGEIIKDTDIEKGIEWKDIIIERKSDNKLFKFHIGDSYYNGMFYYGYKFPVTLKEVFPKQIITTIYE